MISSSPRGRRFATGPRGCCSSAMRSVSRTSPYLCYIVPRILGGKTSWITIPGPLLDGRPDQQELRLNDVVEVPLKYAREVLDGKWGQDWALAYALTVHSSQGLTVADPQNVWIIDDYLQWSNLAYLAVSRVEYLIQLEPVVCPPEEGYEGGPLTEPDESSLRKTIIKKLVDYKRQDQAKGLRFSLKVYHILALREAQGDRCAACNIELL